MSTTYNSRNPYIQALGPSARTSYKRSVSPLQSSYSSRIHESPRVTTTVTSYNTPNYNFSAQTTRSTRAASATPPTVRGRHMSPGIPHIAHQRLTPSAIPPRTNNSYLDDFDLIGAGGNTVSSHSKYDSDLSAPLIQQLEQEMSGLRAQINTVTAKIHDNSHMKGMHHVYTVPGFSGRGERQGTERPGRTGGFADNRILGPMRDVHHDVHNMARYEEPTRKAGIGKGHLACLEFAGGKPVLKRRQKFYDDEKIPLEIKILSNYNNKPRHERRGPVEPKLRKDLFSADGYVPWRERLAKDLTYVAPEPSAREEIPEPEQHNPDRNWDLPVFEAPASKQIEEKEIEKIEKPVVEPVVELAEVEEITVKKDKKKKKHSRVEDLPEPVAEVPQPEPVIVEPVPEVKELVIPQLNIESDIEDALIVDHENAEGYDEHVRSDSEQVVHLDHKFISSDEGGSPIPMTPLPDDVIENGPIPEETEQEPTISPRTTEDIQLESLDEQQLVAETAVVEEDTVEAVNETDVMAENVVVPEDTQVSEPTVVFPPENETPELEVNDCVVEEIPVREEESPASVEEISPVVEDSPAVVEECSAVADENPAVTEEVLTEEVHLPVVDVTEVNQESHVDDSEDCPKPE